MMSPRDQAIISNLIQQAITPLVSKIETKVDRLDEKVDLLSQNHASRADLEQLRKDIQLTYVPRDAYEPRHAALINRDTQLEADLKQHAAACSAEFQRLHERLESGKQQFEDRLKVYKDEQAKELKEQKSTSLSDQDRRWIRWTQVFSIAAVALTVLDLILQHVHFS